MVASDERQRLLALVLLGLEIERRRLIVDLAQTVDGAGGVEQMLGQGGLARVRVAGEHDVAEARHVNGGHGGSI